MCSSDEEHPSRDEAKRRKEHEKLKEKMIDGGMMLLKMVKKHPRLWGDDYMKEFRNIAYEITGDPSKYCPRRDEKGFGRGNDILTKNIGALLHDKRLLEIETQAKPVYLQITHAENAMQRNEIDDCSVTVRKWKFMAQDGDNKSIMLRIDSTLNTAGNLLAPGAIVEVQSYMPVYFRYSDDSEKRCAIVVRQFEVVGRHQLTEEQRGPPKNRVKPEKGKLSVQPQKKKARHHTVSSLPSCSCNGELCSQHGVEFITCLTRCIPVQSVSLPSVARECVFVTKKHADMTPRDKRFLLYYYYATTIYQFHGKGNRVELPECLKRAVREHHPDAERIE
ncbi:hypothetical protein ACHAWF_015516 [Thalassiosira exigua]